MYTTQTNSTKTNTKSAKLPVFNDDQDLRQFLERNMEDSLKQLIKVSVTTMVRHELETLRSELPEPPAFNGHYSRQLTSPYGRIENVPVPRFRQGFGPETTPQTLQVFETEQQRFIKVVQQMHLMGISQRNVKRLAKLCFNVDIATATVGSIHKELAAAEEAKLNSRTLTGIPYRYLIVDGVWAKAKGYGWENNDAVMLCAIGIRDAWHTFLASLIVRGLDKTNLKLVIADDGAGFRAAKDKLLPSIPLQICIVHKMRGVMSKPVKNTAALSYRGSRIFTAAKLKKKPRKRLKHS